MNKVRISGLSPHNLLLTGAEPAGAEARAKQYADEKIGAIVFPPAPTLSSLGAEPAGAETRAKQYTDEKLTVISIPPLPDPEQIGAIALSEKGSPRGVATLGIDGKVPGDQLPIPPAPPKYTAADVEAIAASEKGVADGVATLGTDGKVPSAQLPPQPPRLTLESLGGLPVSQKGAANGLATLGSDGKVSTEQLPPIPATQIFPITHQHFWGFNSKSLQNKAFNFISNQQFQFSRIAFISPPEKGDIVEFKALLQKGEYRFIVLGDQYTDRGIASFFVNNLPFGQVDFYRASGYNASFKSDLLFTLNESGIHTFKVVADKNNASTSYLLAITAIFISLV